MRFAGVWNKRAELRPGSRIVARGNSLGACSGSLTSVALTAGRIGYVAVQISVNIAVDA